MWCCHPLWRKPGYEIDQEAMDAAKTAIRQYMQQLGSAGRWWSDSAVPKSTVKGAGKPHETFHDDSENPDFFFAPTHVADSDYGFKKVDSKMFRVVTWLTQGPLHILRFK